MVKNVILCSLLLLIGCKSSTNQRKNIYQKLSGQTMGVISYTITYEGNENYQFNLDSLMNAINNELSTYIPASAISRFNNSQEGIELESDQYHFLKNIAIAINATAATEGTYDPTVMPIVNYWGFGYKHKKEITAVDQRVIDSLLTFVGIKNIKITDQRILKTKAGVELDFSASAKGYFIDEVSKYLEQKGISNYMVEIGGENRVSGLNPDGELWKLGISTPRENAEMSDLFAAVQLKNQSIATSGNYRNYYTTNGVTYSHTINPVSGLPERNNLLSASVITKECAYADAYATACMVMGLERAKTFINSLANVEAYFIYSDENNELKTYATEAIADKIRKF